MGRLGLRFPSSPSASWVGAEHCWAAGSRFGGSVCCVGMGRLPPTVLQAKGACLQAEGIACSKLCLFVYHPFARHIGCVAAGKSDPSFGTMRTFVAVAVRDGAQAGLSRALSAAPLPR